jgi:hypothetical protein
MNNKILGAGIVIVIIIAITAIVILPISEVPLKINEKIGLVINSPSQSITLQQLDQIYLDAANTGIGRNNIYLFWNVIEPVKNEYDWRQSDILMSLNQKHDLKVTLYFSIINGEILGPFPNWIGKPPLQNLDEDRLVNVLDSILSRYDIIDTVIIAGQTESQFRFHEQNIPVYKELFNTVYTEIKQKHPDVKIGNSFALHQALSKNLSHIVSDLAIGDFVAFSYAPVDVLNEIVKTPIEAKQELQQIFDLVGDKKVGIFELSWSTSDFVGGDDSKQTEFLEKSFEFYIENESNLEFFTWYRQYDKLEGTCNIEKQEIGDSGVLSVEGSGFGTSEHVIERLSNYICNAGLINDNGTPKSSWDEFKKQIHILN